MNSDNNTLHSDNNTLNSYNNIQYSDNNTRYSTNIICLYPQKNCLFSLNLYSQQ